MAKGLLPGRQPTEARRSDGMSVKDMEPLHEWLETWALAAKNVYVYDEKGIHESRQIGRFPITGEHKVLLVGLGPIGDWYAAEGAQETRHKAAILQVYEDGGPDEMYVLVSSWHERVWSREAEQFFERRVGRCVLTKSMTFLVNALTVGEIKALGAEDVVELLRK